MSKEISLADWVSKKKVSPRTASEWAKTGKIPAKKRWKSVPRTITRRVETYFVPADTKLPS